MDIIGFFRDLYDTIPDLTFRGAVIAGYLFTIFAVAAGWLYVYHKEEGGEEERPREKADEGAE